VGAKETIQAIESKKAGFFFWLAAFFAVILLRNLFEGLLENLHGIISFYPFFIHYILSWISMYLMFVLVLKLLSKESIIKVSKIVLVFFPIILIVPVIDFIATSGAGLDIDYAFGGPSYFVSQYFSFAADYPGMGVTPGQKTVIAISALFSAFYCWSKTKSKVRTISAAVLVYTFLGLYAYLPSLLGMLAFGISGWEQMAGIATPIIIKYALDLLYVFLIISQLMLWLLLWDKKKLSVLILDIRPLRTAHYVFLMPIFGILVYPYFTPSPMDWMSIAGLFIAAFFAFQASVAINDLGDQSIDRINNKKRLLVKGALSPGEYKKIAIAEAAIALVLAYIVFYEIFVLILCSLALAFVYSMQPFRLRRFVFVSTFVLALISLLGFFSGYFVAGAASFAGMPFGPPLFILIFITLAFNAKDLKDIEGDRKAGVSTIPVLIGEQKARSLISHLIALSYILAPFLLGLPLLFFFPLSIGFALINYFLLLRLKTGERAILLVYFIYAVIAGSTVFF